MAFHRRFSRQLAISAVIFAALLPLPSHADTAYHAAEKGNPATAKATDESIRPFQYHASDEQLDDLKQRVNATKWPSRELVNDDTQGVRLDTMKKLAARWSSGYDWRVVEKRLNSLPQFVTTIDGVDIHFIHVRSRHENAMPIIVTHGWPGSIVEQLKIIDPLTDPTAHGGTEADALIS